MESDLDFEFDELRLAMVFAANWALGTTPQWGAADAEIKVSSGEKTELKRSPFKAWSESVYSHTCYAYCQDFLLAYFYPSGPFTCIFPKPLTIFSYVGCG